VTGSGHARSTGGPARRRAGPFVLCATLLSLVPAGAGAADRTFEVAASAGLLHVRYEERGPYGDTLDTEDGWIPSLGVRVRGRAWRLVGELSGRLARGDLAYEGLVPSLGWVRSTSASRFLEGALRAGVVVDPWGRVALLAGAAARRWDRDIRGTTIASGGITTPVRGLSEVYAWYELDAAARATLVETPRLAWLAEVRVLRTASPHLTVDWSGTDVGLSLGSRTGWGGETELQVTLRPGLFLTAGAAIERLGFGASGLVPAGRTWINEPDSETWNVRLDLGIGARF
jgi:hypothetical protein